jgi:hypothetical protein
MVFHELPETKGAVFLRPKLEKEELTWGDAWNAIKSLAEKALEAGREELTNQKKFDRILEP